MMQRFVKENESFPRFYGLAYRDYLRGHAVCYPIPINLIVRFLWGALLHLKNPRPSRLDVALSQQPTVYLILGFNNGRFWGVQSVWFDEAKARAHFKVVKIDAGFDSVKFKSVKVSFDE